MLSQRAAASDAAETLLKFSRSISESVPSQVARALSEPSEHCIAWGPEVSPTVLYLQLDDAGVVSGCVTIVDQVFSFAPFLNDNVDQSAEFVLQFVIGSQERYIRRRL